MQRRPQPPNGGLEQEQQAAKITDHCTQTDGSTLLERIGSELMASSRRVYRVDDISHATHSILRGAHVGSTLERTL